MTEELKIQLDNWHATERQIIFLGAVFTQVMNVKDTYFHQSNNKILKISETDSGNYIVELQKKNGKFIILKRKAVTDTQEMKRTF